MENEKRRGLGLSIVICSLVLIVPLRFPSHSNYLKKFNSYSYMIALVQEPCRQFASNLLVLVWREELFLAESSTEHIVRSIGRVRAGSLKINWCSESSTRIILKNVSERISEYGKSLNHDILICRKRA